MIHESSLQIHSTAAVEVKKTKSPIGLAPVKDFLEKTGVFSALNPEKRLIPAYFSTGGFTDEAKKFCRENGIASASEIGFYGG